VSHEEHHLKVPSQWPAARSSFAQTLGSWARISLKTRMSVCVYSVCVFLCVGSGLATG
jgi:hypothetical protein